MGRATAGVAAIRLGKGDEVVGMDVVRPDSKARCWSSPPRAWASARISKSSRARAAQAAACAPSPSSARAARIAVARVVSPDDDLVVISTKGQVIRMFADDIPHKGRPAQGVAVMNMRDGDEVASMARVPRTDRSGKMIGDDDLEVLSEDDAASAVTNVTNNGHAKGNGRGDGTGGGEPTVVVARAKPRATKAVSDNSHPAGGVQRARRTVAVKQPAAAATGSKQPRQAAATSLTKPTAKPTTKPTAAPAVKPASKPSPKAAATTKPRAAATSKVAAKPASRVEPKAAPKPATNSKQSAAAAKPAARPVPKPSATAGTKPQPKAAPKTATKTALNAQAKPAREAATTRSAPAAGRSRSKA